MVRVLALDGSTNWTFCESSITSKIVDGPTTTTAVLRDERYKITASIVLDPKRTSIRVSFYHATRYNRALAEAARLYAMILDTHEDFLEVAERDPREAQLTIDRPVLDGAALQVQGVDAFTVLYGFFGDALEDLLEHVGRTPGTGASDRVLRDCRVALAKFDSASPAIVSAVASARARCEAFINALAKDKAK